MLPMSWSPQAAFYSMQGLSKIIQKNIQSSFSTFAGGSNPASAGLGSLSQDTFTRQAPP